MSVCEIEIVRPPNKSCDFRFAIFDFDGTLSLLREGWQSVMVSYFVEVILNTSPNECELSVNNEVKKFVDLLTGKQTIYQCIHLVSAVERRDIKALSALEYKTEYLRRLMEKIKWRVDSLYNFDSNPNDYLVSGCVDFLQILRNKNISLYLASGTDEPDVVKEAELLKIAKYFDGGIYGASDSTMECAKETAVRKILSKNGMDPSQLLVFGDGYVEIQLVKSFGGYAVAVATNEATRKGIDPDKRERLLSAGADAVIADFSEPVKLANYLIGA